MDIKWNPQDKDFNAPSYDPPVRSSKMVGWVVKLSGGTISESQANYVLLGLAGVFLVLTIFVMIGMVQKPSVEPTYLEDLPQEVVSTLSPDERAMIPSRNVK